MRSLLPIGHGRDSVHRAWLPVLYPELKRMPAESWPQALKRARRTELSTGERIGVLTAVALSAYLLQRLGDPEAGLFLRFLEQFLLALPAIALLASPWLVRRTRRGLQHEAQRFDGGESCPESQTPTSRTGTEPSPTAREQRTGPIRNS